MTKKQTFIDVVGAYGFQQWDSAGEAQTATNARTGALSGVRRVTGMATGRCRAVTA